METTVLFITPGVQTEDAIDWADSLGRMYVQWARRNGLEATMYRGKKRFHGNRTVIIRGKDSHLLFDNEAGIHSLTRISPFDELHRRTTSFASIEVKLAESERRRIYVLDPYKKADDLMGGALGCDPERILAGDLSPLELYDLYDNENDD